MKSVLAMIFSFFLFTSIAHANHKDKPATEEEWKARNEKLVEERMVELTEELSLSKDQQKQVRKNLEEKMEKKRQAYHEMHEKMDKIHNDHVEAMKGILDDKQEKKFGEIVEKHKADRMKKHEDCKGHDDKQDRGGKKSKH